MHIINTKTLGRYIKTVHGVMVQYVVQGHSNTQLSVLWQCIFSCEGFSLLQITWLIYSRSTPFGFISV